ncbi:MAG: peptidase [Nitrosarchaeum sp.]|nr:peptidase [Nitrosarchaeum sp.]
MKKIIVSLIVIVLATGLISNASAHKAEIVGNYKIEVGWKNEPPIVNEPNAVELVLTLASDYEKDSSQSQSSTPAKESDLTGLADKLEVDITLNGKKTFLTLNEESKFPGVYHSEFTPTEIGTPNVHVYGKIQDVEFERTFHPEAVEESSVPINTESQNNVDVKIPDWVKNNAKWWVEGQVDDSTFASGLQFLLKEKIIVVPATEKGTAQNTTIPDWVKNNAKWWSDGQIDDKTFASGIQFLIKQGIISV